MIGWIRGLGLGFVLVLAVLAPGGGAFAATGFVPAADLVSGGIASDGPVLGFAPNGYAAAAWIEPSAGTQTVLRVALRPPGGPWSSPQDVAAGSTAKFGLSVVVDAAGDAAVAWQDLSAQASVATLAAGGAFGAPELLADAAAPRASSPAAGIDGTGRVTLVYSAAPNVVARTFAAGSSVLAATPEVLSSGCAGGLTHLAVAPSGDAVAGWFCNGAVFAQRNAGSWTVAPVVPSTNGVCPAPTTVVLPAAVAIDTAGRAVGLLQTTRTVPEPTCTLQVTVSTTTDLRLVLPAGGAMTPLPDPPAATATIAGAGLPISGGGVAIDGGELLLAYGALTGARYQPQVASFGSEGSPRAPATPLGTSLSADAVFPRVALAPDGRALVGWTQTGSPGGGGAVLAAVRPPAGTFGDPLQLGIVPVAAALGGVALDDAGDGAVAFRDGGSGLSVHARVRGYDGSPPALGAVSIPARATVGVPAPFAVSASDLWGPLSLTWSFGDGASAAGAAASHAFARTGTFAVTVTARDGLGNAVSRSANVVVATTAQGAHPPQLSRLSLSATRFRVGSKPTAVSAVAKSRIPMGTSFRFALDRAASVSIAFERATGGRVSGKRCVKPTRRLSGHRRCTLYVKAGALTRSLKAGAARVAFSGRVGRRPLAVAGYRATLTPRASGQTGTSHHLGFRVVR